MVKPPVFDRGAAARRRQRGRLWLKIAPFAAVALAVIVMRIWGGISLPGDAPPSLSAASPGGQAVAGEVVEVHATFVLCSEPGYAVHCVTDGDTFRIGDRRIRVLGIDAPETRGRCPAESAAAASATLALREWLNRGPFLMQPAADAERDVYERELQAPWREVDGAREELGAVMIGSGHARAYEPGNRPDWCRLL